MPKRQAGSRLRDEAGPAPRRGWSAVGSFAIETVYPRRCAECCRRGVWVCDACRRNLILFEPPWCHRCGVPTIQGGCRCDSLPDEITGVRSVGPYRGWLRCAILDLKYRDERARAAHLGDELARVVALMPPADALVPVPLHGSRQRRRGYNQAALLARHASVTSGVPMVGALVRTRSAPSQVGADAVRRRSNVEGAFAIDAATSPIRGRRVVLVDDVVTTGSTVVACAKALRGAGATEIWVATLAREL